MLLKKRPDNIEHKNELAVLDGLRGLAALYVLMHHARWQLSQPYLEYLKNKTQYSIIDKGLIYLTSGFRFGHEAVILFFIISGFVIHLKQARSSPKAAFTNFKTLNYLFKRILRIYPTLLLSFFVTWFLDVLLSNINHQPIPASDAYTFRTFFENLFLIPSGHIWGSNGPMWSLRHEWFFYLMYPLLLLLDTVKPALSIIVCLILFLSYTYNITIPLIDQAAYTLLIWWTGALLANAYANRQNNSLLRLCMLLTLPGFIVSVLIPYGPFHDLACGFLFVGMIAIILNNKLPPVNSLVNRFSFLGYFSYSIYILHFPMVLFLKGIIIRYNHQLPYHLWYVLGAGFIILPVIFILYLLVEKPFLRIKANLSTASG
ncbi:acyltransferase [Mucilaginibacter sp.]|uniref:acyltransferase family protein n=1 Tax=Mucilaginibacter sp. TaxID=1882438 RepID=UPI0026384ADB|nr:acyltransferase [Mucilaginibacter sp.]MDB4927006.1 acyltransferase family protein [Mucilaginibacter sp.]